MMPVSHVYHCTLTHKLDFRTQHMCATVVHDKIMHCVI